MAAAFGQMGYHVAACDIAGEMIDVARSAHTGSAVEWTCLDPDWRVLPFADCAFDGIVASSVFEYLTDVQHVATELSRVLRPEGTLLLTVPNPFNFIRRLEGWFRKMPSNCHLLSLLGRVPYLSSYAMYLVLSRNRFGADGWHAVLSAADFEALDKRDFSSDAWRRQDKAPLILLAVKRAAAG
jgi:SAM-dependent methyltransferase